jgi:organic hydroperoxide reductase OsmC/OhrA
MVAGQKLIELPVNTSVDAKVSLGTSTAGVAISVNLLVNLPGLEGLLAKELMINASKFCPYANVFKSNTTLQLAAQPHN